jgi:ABC-type branched-subunit amino acid transport system substrate-binding protein
MSKLILTFLTLSFLSFGAHANFQDTMKAMGEDYKRLGAEAKNGAFNNDALALAQDLSNLIHQAQSERPDADVLNPYNTPENVKFYTILDNSYKQSLVFIAALQSGNQAASVQAFVDLAKIAKTGHDAYKPVE